MELPLRKRVSLYFLHACMPCICWEILGQRTRAVTSRSINEDWNRKIGLLQCKAPYLFPCQKMPPWFRKVRTLFLSYSGRFNTAHKLALSASLEPEKGDLSVVVCTLFATNPWTAKKTTLGRGRSVESGHHHRGRDHRESAVVVRIWLQRPRCFRTITNEMCVFLSDLLQTSDHFIPRGKLFHN